MWRDRKAARPGISTASLEDAVKAAEQGMKSTAEMLSQKGRSSRLGERSLGHQDPGATSAYMILDSFTHTIKSLQSLAS